MQFRLVSALLLSVAALATPVGAQQSSSDYPPSSLAHQARGAKATTAPTSSGSEEPPAAGKSLADRARELRGQELGKVKVSPEQAREILRSIQPLLEFASEDSGLAIRSAVKPRMKIGRAHV